ARSFQFPLTYVIVLKWRKNTFIRIFLLFVFSCKLQERNIFTYSALARTLASLASISSASWLRGKSVFILLYASSAVSKSFSSSYTSPNFFKNKGAVYSLLDFFTAFWLKLTALLISFNS